VQPSFTVTTAGVTGPRVPVGEPEPIPAGWLNGTAALAGGIISTSNGPAPPFAATWDLFEMTEDTPEPSDNPPVITQPTLTPAPTPVTPRVASNVFSFGKPILNKRRGTAILPITVPGPGILTLSGKGVVRQTKTPTTAGTVKLPIKAKGGKKALLATGRVKVEAKVTYAPSGGTADSKTKALILKRADTKKPRRSGASR
ncbi:MAG TPA: hypothetical protein VKA35_08440, partial [Solirubrobacterales bacterium]|nr:hypothetical protein [Solirubrobacterales bacterium]